MASIVICPVCAAAKTSYPRSIVCKNAPIACSAYRPPKNAVNALQYGTDRSYSVSSKSKKIVFFPTIVLHFRFFFHYTGFSPLVKRPPHEKAPSAKRGLSRCEPRLGKKFPPQRLASPV